MTVVVVIWVPVIQDAKGGEIFKYVSSVNGYLGAPTCAMFVLAMFWSRITEPVRIAVSRPTLCLPLRMPFALFYDRRYVR